MLLEVKFFSPKEILFQGQAKRVMVPGEQGVFEVLPFHKHILSRLISGKILIDEEIYAIRRGVIKASQNKVLIVAEQT